MADPIVISAAILSAARIANDIFNLIRALRDTDDPRVKLLKYRLMTQREMMISWARRARQPGSQEFEIPEQSARAVEQILAQMVEYFERAERKMDRIYQAPDGKMTAKTFIQRFLFTKGGFQDIRDITDALDEMNKALQLIAPPLPPYEELEKASKSHKQEITKSTSEVDAAENPEDEREASGLDEIRAIDTSIPISRLYAGCEEALIVISKTSAVKERFQKYLERLKRWGCGILSGGSLSLDAIFTERCGVYSELESILIRVLINIAVLAERFLRRIGSGSELRGKNLEHDHSKLLNSLGSPQFSKIALEYWSGILACEKSREDPSSPSRTTANVNRAEENQDQRQPSLEQIEQEVEAFAQAVEKSVSRQQITTRVRVKEEHFAETLDDSQAAQISCCIDILFDLSPAIRRVRRQRLLELQAIKKSQMDTNMLESTATDVSVNEGTQTLYQRSSKESLVLIFDQMLDQSLRLAESLETRLQNDETWAQKNKIQVQPFSEKLRKEINQLHYMRGVAANQALSEEEIRRIVNTMGTLNETFVQAIKDVSIPAKAPSTREKSPQFHLIESKIPTKDGDQTVKELLDKLAASNNELWLHSPKRTPQMKAIKV